MEKVASHINEMQKIYEDYGSVFDQLVAEQTGHDKEVDAHFHLSSLSPSRVWNEHVKKACGDKRFTR